MSRNRDPELAERLREMRVPDEAEAEERAWELVRAAYAERTPARPAPRTRRAVLAIAAAAAALAVGLSPAGAEVGELVERVIGVGEPDAAPTLGSLPAAGELLVESAQGAWIVREDGSKRLLGDYDEATWSPRGLFVAVADGRQLLAVDPLGEVRWTITAPGPVRDPRWSPSGYRIAYRSAGHLYVVAGDGTGERPVARDVRPVAPAWRPLGDSKLTPEAAGGHVLTYVEDDGEIKTIDVDAGSRERTTDRDLEQLSTPPTGASGRGASSPDGTELATIRHAGRRDELTLSRDGAPRTRVLFSARGVLSGPSWSPDGRWLLVGWPQADQWLFIPTERRGRVIAVDRISEQFDPGASGDGSFPTVAGWVLPQR